MAKGNETTTKFKVDISELKKSMQEARKQVAYANSEFKAVSSSMDDWSKSSEGLGAKLKQLNSNLKSQESVLSEYEKTLEQVKKEYGENSKEALEYATKLNNQQAVVNKIKKEISGYEDALQDVSKAEKIASKSGQDVADVLADLGNEANDAGDGFTVLKGAMAEFVGNGLTALVGGIKDAIGSFISLANETREYREDMNKLESAFTTAGFTTDQATKVYKDFSAVLGEEDRSVEAVNHLAQMVSSEKDLAKWTNIATGVWATFGDSLPIEGLTEASNETAKTGQITGGLADALNWAGIAEDDFQKKLDICSTEQQRQKLIMETLNGVYDEASKKYQETNKSVMDANRANSEYTDTIASMGERIEPVTTALKSGFTGLLQELLKLVSDVDMEAFTAKIEEGFAVLKDEVLPAVKDGFGWILDNKDQLIAGLAGIATGFVAFNVASTIMAVVNAFKAFKVANEGATIAQWALNTAMNANPIMLIVTLIATVVGAIITFIATNEDARAKISAVWDAVKEKIGSFVESVKVFFTQTIPAVFQSLIDFVKTNWQAILLFLINPFAGLFKYFYDNNSKFKEFVDSAIKFIKELPAKAWKWLQETINKVNTWRSNMVAKAKETALNFINNVINFVKQLPEKVYTWLSNALSKVTAWGTNLATKGKEAGQKLLTSLVEKVKEIPAKIKTIGSDIVKGLWNGISNMAGWIKDKISGFGEDILDELKDFFDIHSPSRVMRDQIGKNLALGVAEGIAKNQKYANKSAVEMGDIILDTAKSRLTSYQATNELSLQDEVEYWDTLRKTVKKGTEAKIEIEKIYTQKKKKLQEEEKKTNAKNASADKNYVKESEKIYEQLIKDIDAVTQKYEEAVTSRAESIASSLSLFDKFEADDTINKVDLSKNLLSQVKALEEWDKTLDKLSNREGVSDELMAELESMGVESLNTLKQLNSMSDKELADYIALYDKKNAVALARSEKENVELKQRSQLEISELIAEARVKLEALGVTYNAELVKLAISSRDTSKGIGENVVTGIEIGINQHRDELKEFMRDFMQDILDEAKEALDINSPSRVFAKEVGRWIPEGIAVGISDNAKSVLSAMRELTGSSLQLTRDNLISGSGATGGVVNNFYQTINAPKQLSRLEIYRQSKNLLGYAGGGF